MTKSNTDGFYFSVTTIILLVISLFMLVNKSSNTKNQLQQEINIQNQILDSLKHKIDTLMWEKEIWDHNIENNTTHLLSAIMLNQVIMIQHMPLMKMLLVVYK